MADILYLGDSLGVGTSPHVKGARADVKVGRRSSEAAALARKRFKGQHTIVFDVGTNDPSPGELRRSIRQLRRVVGDNTRIVMSTVNGPGARQKNRLLKRLEQKGAIQLFNGRRVELSGDRIHPTGRGYAQRAKALERALEQTEPIEAETIHFIDSARVNGESLATIRAALVKAGLDHHRVIEEYQRTPFADGRLRGEVNLSDPNEWQS